MDGEGIEIPTSVEEADDVLTRGHATLFRTADGEIGLRLFHRPGEGKPIRTAEYPKVDMVRYYGHSDTHVREWLEHYTVEVEPSGGYASEPEST